MLNCQNNLYLLETYKPKDLDILLKIYEKIEKSNQSQDYSLNFEPEDPLLDFKKPIDLVSVKFIPFISNFIGGLQIPN